MSHSLSYNSTDCGGSSYGLYVMDIETQLMAPPRLDMQDVAQGWGAAAACRNYGVKEFSLHCAASGTSASNLRTKLDALRLLLNPMNGEKALKFDDFESDRFWYAFLSSEIPASVRGASWIEFDLSFIAPDPRAYSTTETDLDFTIETDPDAFTLKAAGVAVGGTAEIEPVWTITNSSGGAVSSVRLSNATTLEAVLCTTSLANGNLLRIDRARWAVEKSTDGGSTYTSVISATSSESVPPSISPGETNAVTVTGLSAGTLNATYRERYL